MVIRRSFYGLPLCSREKNGSWMKESFKEQQKEEENRGIC